MQHHGRQRDSSDEPESFGSGQATGLGFLGFLVTTDTRRQVPRKAPMDQPPPPPLLTSSEVDVDLGFALFFLLLLCVFLLATIVRCAQTVVDPYGAISTSTYQEEQIT
ncbi:cortexin domain-containing 1-like [Alosa alosa]|uniref:cortexin domain-containing 1-like n=1 Tax=Alosa alosa TaxID=278164 RepID=UPI002015125B|nr:cortexin domain-containing 1-like [Alosa alosa]